MMKTFHAILLALLLQSPLYGQSPCLSVNEEPLDCNALPDPASPKTVLGQTVDLRISDQPATLDAVRDARYVASWIYGDGNFKFPPINQDVVTDAATLLSNYTYATPGTYQPYALLIEKKSNTEPPGYTGRLLDVQRNPNAAQPPPSTQQRRLVNNDKTAEVLSNSVMRPKFPTAFAASSPATLNTTDLYFFYNSFEDPSSHKFASAQVQQLEDIRLPDYMQNATPATGETVEPALAAVFGEGAWYNIKTVYKSYIHISINDASISTKSKKLEEYRFFPILKTIWSDTTLPRTQFLVLVVGNNSGLVPNPDGPVGFFTPEKLDALHNKITEYLGANAGIGTNFQIGNTNNFVRGIDRIQVDMLASIDPNELEVERICRENDGLYKVELRFEVCNKGYLDEHNLPVSFRNLSGSNFTDLMFVDSTDVDGLLFDATTNSWTFTWKGEWGAHANPFLPDAENMPECRELHFTLRTDWAGVQAFAHGQGLEACVQFVKSQTTHPECHNNYPLDLKKVNKLGYRCGDEECCYTFYICMVVGFLFLLFLFWIWKRSRKQGA